MFAIRQGLWKPVEGDTDGDSREGHDALARSENEKLLHRDPVTGKFQPFAYDVPDVDPQNPVYRLYKLLADPAESTGLCQVTGQSQPAPEFVESLSSLPAQHAHSCYCPAAQ